MRAAAGSDGDSSARAFHRRGAASRRLGGALAQIVRQVVKVRSATSVVGHDHEQLAFEGLLCSAQHGRAAELVVSWSAKACPPFPQGRAQALDQLGERARRSGSARNETRRREQRQARLPVYHSPRPRRKIAMSSRARRGSNHLDVIPSSSRVEPSQCHPRARRGDGDRASPRNPA